LLLNSHNYVVDQWLVVKLCDFGMATTASPAEDNGGGSASRSSASPARPTEKKVDKNKEIAGTVSMRMLPTCLQFSLIFLVC
jgi:serine/threonine protein kinase